MLSEIHEGGDVDLNRRAKNISSILDGLKINLDQLCVKNGLKPSSLTASESERRTALKQSRGEEVDGDNDNDNDNGDNERRSVSGADKVLDRLAPVKSARKAWYTYSRHTFLLFAWVSFLLSVLEIVLVAFNDGIFTLSREN